MTISVGRCLKKKIVVRGKGVHHQKLCNCKRLCSSQELYTALTCNKYILHRLESCPGNGTQNNFLTKNAKNMKMIRNLMTVSGTLWIEQYLQPLQSLTKKNRVFD